MKIQCDVCERAPATVICCADEAALCANCDIEVHAANKLASKHQRLLLQCLSNKLPPCDICQPTYTIMQFITSYYPSRFSFVNGDFKLMGLDENVHIVYLLNRFMILDGVALGSSCTKDTKKSCLEPPNQSAQQTSMKLPVQQPSSLNSSWAVDDLMQFSDFESTTDKQKEQLEFGEFQWLADMGIFGEQLPQEALAALKFLN
ncbi:hypothetical protein GH714_006624 [Hevea brasiliensis]|uniref:B box-type domain-containing protein n=1 Tax=Hevea brasiliensis TaxID=3981 RepID=A0A6A6N9M7_HEVBR|nr:hypothetical protein GH714_006624 [Hevea brasiliensis]